MSHGRASGNSVAEAGESQAIAGWLERIADERDFTIAPPAGTLASDLAPLVAALSAELVDYAEIVASAREAARRNGGDLESIVRSTGEQTALVRATATAASDAGAGARRMADAADELQDVARGATSAAGLASEHLATIRASLGALVTRLEAGAAPLGEMRRSTSGVAAFLGTLARLARHAQLLGVNASIEAAHLADGGSRFGIVAQEVGRLGRSTRESRADVAKIVSELRAATDHVSAAMNESQRATGAAQTEIVGAGQALEQTSGGIRELEAIIATAADVAATQCMALESIQSSIDGIAHHTDDAAAASREAARADLESLLERASVRASKWTPRSAVQATALPAHGPLTDWIAALLRGADPRTAAPVDGDDGVRLVVGAVRALLELVNAEARAILGDLIQAAVAVSRNGYAWNSIGGSLDAVSEEITIVRATVDESAKAAQASAELAGQVRSLVDTIRTRYAAALALLDGALGRIAGITSSVGEIDAFVESMGTAAARADEIMGLIETLSAETDLLSLNAAIEAAHAGELGLGFGVIAEEIGALARSTNESTSSVSQLVSNVSRISSDLQRSIGAAAASMDGVGSDAAGVRGAIETLRTSFEAAIDRAHDVSGTAETQQSALGRVRDDVQRSSAAAEENARAVTDDRRIELSMLGSRAHAVAARRPLGTVVERVRALSESLSMGIEDALASALRSGRVSPERLFELRYTPIAGEEIASLARLFDISRVPAGGFSPPKYAAPWDACVDEALIDVLSTGWDEALAAGISPVAMFVSDLNGFFYAYPRQKIGPWTNDPASDGLGNRIKRIFDDDYSLRVVRAGLGPHAHGLGKRLPYEAFRTAGCELERTAERPWSASVYARDTNAVCNEVCSALFVNGRRHGALRVCYEPNLV